MSTEKPECLRKQLREVECGIWDANQKLAGIEEFFTGIDKENRHSLSSEFEAWRMCLRKIYKKLPCQLLEQSREALNTEFNCDAEYCRQCQVGVL